MAFSLVLVDADVSDQPPWNSPLLKSSSVVLTGRREDALKEAARHFPADRFVDYILISEESADLTRSQRILAVASEYARLKSDVENLTSSKESTEAKLRKVSASVREIGDALSKSLVRELEKRVAVETRYLSYRKLKEKFETALRKLYAANDFGKLLDIVFDIKGLIRAEGISLYILEEDENLGKYLKPLVWDNRFSSDAESDRHIALLQSQDFAAYVARTGEEINVARAATDPRFSGRYRNQLRGPLHNLLGSPLKREGEVIGLLEVYNKLEEGRSRGAGFGPEDEQLLRELSEHVSLAISKLNLIQYDALTGLLRPDPFFEKVIQKIETLSKRRQEIGCYALVMGDVDWFKNYNDINGHEAGNRLLHELAGILKKSIREEDFLCRYGGEEFLFFLSGVGDLREAALLTDRIRKNVEDYHFPFEESQPRQNLTMSFGVTLLPHPKRTMRGSITKASLKEIVHEADIALAEAKEKKQAALRYDESVITKNRVCAFVRDRATVLSDAAVLKGLGDRAFVERRKFERYLTTTLCIYKDNGGHGVASAVDLSLGGMRLSAKKSFPVSKTLDLFLILGSRANPMRGVVVYSRKASEDSAFYQTGLKFRDVTAADRQDLQNYFVMLNKRLRLGA
jgi:diguanylate cyclase (GGDEF)-like protein